MISRKLLGTVAAGLALGVAAVSLASTAWAVANTAGLASLKLEGIGSGSLASGECATVACQTTHTCECLSASYTLVGNQGFSKGALVVNLSVDTTTPGLPISDLDSCFPAAGNVRLSNLKATIVVNMTVSGLECPTLAGPNIFNGSYVITSASGGKFSSSSGGTGSIDGSQETTGTTGQVAVVGTIQPTTPSGSSTADDSEQAPSTSSDDSE
jgi:hypothetical protein